MKTLKFLSIVASVSLFFLGACSNTNQANSPENNSTSQPTQSVVPTTTPAKTESSNHAAVLQKGGQFVESGPYHLEFVPEKEASGTYLDFYFQKGDNHEAIPNAKVTAQVQLPDGTQKTLNLNYDTAGKHYAVLLPGTIPGQYQVKMTADINGEKVNGRFNFNR